MKDEVKNKNSKYRLIFILDSYDEIKEEFQYKNLYNYNDLQEWGPPYKQCVSKIWPKIIVTCRSEFVMGKADHQKWFLPEITGVEYNAYKYLLEFKIDDFSECKHLY